jgi:hypothetical protein
MENIGTMGFHWNKLIHGRGGGVLGGGGFGGGQQKVILFYRGLGGTSRRDNRIPLGGKFSPSARGFYFISGVLG